MRKFVLIAAHMASSVCIRNAWLCVKQRICHSSLENILKILYLPQSDETQEHYSGKAKRHAMKTRYATAYNGLILQTSTAVKGGKHDFAVFKESVPTFPANLPHEWGISLDKQCLRYLRYLRYLKYRANSAYV